MRLLVLLLLKICRLSSRAPRLTIVTFIVLAIAGFCTMPLIQLSTNLMAGLGRTSPVIELTQQNNTIFGEQDSLIVVLEFPEPPGPDRLPFVKGIGEAIAKAPGVRRVRYRFLDPENQQQVTMLFKHFLLGMNEAERSEIRSILTGEGIEAALRRLRNRLFLATDPYLQNRLLADPLDLGRFVSEAMSKRVGAVSFGDMYLLMASPDSTVYLIQITPDFASTDLVKGKELLKRLRTLIPHKVDQLKVSLPRFQKKLEGFKWYLTGKTAFHHESDAIFDAESLRILAFSFAMVTALLIAVYRSLWAGLLLIIPICAGVGPNYGVIYLAYKEVNPVVMGAAGVLFGLGTDYGVHLWGRLRDEIDHGLDPALAVEAVYKETGPPLLLGALSNILAFLCMCLSNQPAMAQFGWVGASGLILTLVSTLFLFPALVTFIAGRRRDHFPRMQVTFKSFSGLFKRSPVTIVGISVAVIVVSTVFAFRLSYEKDLFKVFLARDMASMEISDKISRKFKANFAQPTLLSFDVDNRERGLSIQRLLDHKLEEFMKASGIVNSFDSISYLVSPKAVQEKNARFFAEIDRWWPMAEDAFSQQTAANDFSQKAAARLKQSFSAVENILHDLSVQGPSEEGSLGEVERSWYMAPVDGKYRFLTLLRYSNEIKDTQELRKADQELLKLVKDLPVPVRISGPRQAMEALQSGLVSELARLGLYVLAAVVIFFLALFRHPVVVGLSLIPMAGAFCITLGIMGALGMGVPFSIVGVAPLIFGLGMDNGIHVVMGASPEEGGSVEKAMGRVTRPIIFTSLANVMGFVVMITSRHYSLEFLGWAVVIGMAASVALTLTTLPALLLLVERRRNRIAAERGAVLHTG